MDTAGFGCQPRREPEAIVGTPDNPRGTRNMAKTPKSRKPSAIITGAGSGIGLATAELLIEKGWAVAFLDVNEASLAEARKRHGKAKGMRFVPLDVTDETAVERAIAETAEAFGGIDGVVIARRLLVLFLRRVSRHAHHR